MSMLQDGSTTNQRGITTLICAAVAQQCWISFSERRRSVARFVDCCANARSFSSAARSKDSANPLT